MINRNLIRIRVIQIIYSWYQNSNENLINIEKLLLNGLRKSYDLYYYLLLLMVELTRAYETRIEIKRNKFLPTEEDLNPNTRLIDNKFIHQLATNKQLNKYLSDRPMSWSENEVFIKNLLEEILDSEIYTEYSTNQDFSYDADKDFWRKIFKQFIYRNDALDELLEDESIFWNDDIEIVQTFVMKTIKQFSEKSDADQSLLPMFKNEEDRQYALKLLHDSILNEKKYRSLIENKTDKWDFERIAFMDMIIMQVALAEIHTFQSIPTSVSLNEYIEIAKSYSTPKSGTFINGILDSIVTQLRKENIIFKV